MRAAGTTLHLAPAHVATDTRVFWKECRSLRAAGWGVTVVGLHDRDEVRDGIRIVGLPRGRGWSGRLRNLARVIETIARVRPDVVHVHDFEVLPIAIVLGIARKRVILDFHEDYPLLVQSRSYVPAWARGLAAALVRWLERRAVRCAAGVISAEEQGALRFSPEPVAIVRNYVLESEVAHLVELEPEARKHAAVYVGTVNRERGLMEMVQSVARAGPDVELWVIGDVSAELRQTVLAGPGGDQVRFYGRCGRERTCELLAQSSVGLVLWHPTPKHRGGAVPVKLFEYMAAGLPVVASDFPAIRAVVEPAGAGFLVDPTDVAGVAARIRWVVDHAGAASEMGGRGREAVQTAYCWTREQLTLLDLYERATAGGQWDPAERERPMW